MPWHESDEFWALRERFMFGPAAWDRAPTEVDQILALLGIQPGAKILDLCCGPGRHSLELARRGFTVTGVDRTQAYLAQAEEVARDEELTIEFVLDDMREFRRDDSFDAAINMFTSFGYFEDIADDRLVLENLHSSLRPGGRVLMEMMGKEVLARRFLPRSWTEAEGALMLAERSVDPDWTWIRNREIYIVNGQRHEVDMDHRIYSGGELRFLLESSGFEDVKLYGDLAEAPYNPNARRLVATASRATA